MDATLLDRLCAEVDDAEMARHIDVFAQRMKYSGTPEELESFRYVQAQLEGYGYRTQLLSHDAYISLPGRARVVAGGAEPRCITHSFSRPAPQGVNGELVYVGRGRPEDYAGKEVTGRIVLVEGLATPGASVQATRAGAIGQLHISPDEHLHEMIVSPVWGSPSAAKLAELPTTVVCTVSDRDGGALRDRLAAGEAITATLEAEVDTGWRRTPLLVADLPAPDDDGSYVLLSGHHDTWHYGVMDNGTANATMMEAARVLAGARRHWVRGLRLAFWSGHSHGRYSGSAWYADEHWDDLARNCVAHVNVDSTGGVGNTDVEHVMVGPELAAVARRAIADVTGVAIRPRRLGRGGDQSFWGVGIPAMFGGIGEQPPGSPMHGKFPHPLGWWWHTPGDTLDKVDTAIQNRDTRVYVHTLWQLLASPVAPLDFAENARALEAEVAKLAATLGGRLDLAPLARRAAALIRAVEALNARAAQAGGADGMEARAVTRALVALSRALVPLEYTRGDRFDHDPALPQPVFPALQAIRDLAAHAAEDDTARFLAVTARRARNRVATALDTAIAAADADMAGPAQRTGLAAD